MNHRVGSKRRAKQDVGRARVHWRTAAVRMAMLALVSVAALAVAPGACGSTPATRTILDGAEALAGHDAGGFVASETPGGGESGGMAAGGATGTGGATTLARGSGGTGTGTGGTRANPSGGAGGAGTGGTGNRASGGAGGAGTGGTGSRVSGGAGGAGTGGSGSGANGGSGGARTGSGGAGCTAPPPAGQLIGWAAVSGNGVATTTGGGDATPIQVSTLPELRAAVAATTPAVIYVRGVLPAGNVTVGANKTIVGLCGAEVHGHIEMSGSQNVIVRNLTIVGYAVGDCSLDPKYDKTLGCSSGQDAVSVQKNAHHIWIDHCDISDGTDGNLDITNAADYVTVSWTKFHYMPRTDTGGSDSTGASGHRFSNLVGGTDNPSLYKDAGSLNVTWHHNWWAENVVERMPRVRFGKNHIFNNLYSAVGNSTCVRAGTYAQVLLERNVFAGVRNPHEFGSAADETTAFITATDNAYVAATGTEATGGGGPPFTSPPYAYALDATAGLQAVSQAQAGPH